MDPGHAARTYAEFPAAPTYTDYREMLDREPDIDGVIIATPDHTHAVIAAEAMRRGKHVFCEKPLTRTVAEARALAEMARSEGVVTQMGNQGHALDGTRQIREWIEAGAIGTVSEVQYWTNRPIWPQAIERPTDAHHPPAGLYPRSPGAHQEWIDACKGRGTTGSNFPDHAGPLTEICLLGNLAVRTGKVIEWDAAAMRATNVPEANAFLDEPYRDGWAL